MNHPDAPLPTTMRAIAMTSPGAPDVLHDLEVPVPEVLPGDVLVAVHAAGVNPIDWRTRAGAPTPAARALGSAPHILGWDVAGTVVKVGPGVHRFGLGDRVFGLPWFPRPAGGYAEYVAAPARHFSTIPDGVSFVEAAAVPLAGLTAWQAITEVAGVLPGQRVLVHAAAGGVGHLAVQILAELGAHVVGTSRSHRHPWLRSLGADELIDYTTARVAEATAPVDVALDMVGGSSDSVLETLSAVRDGGVYVPVAPGDLTRASAAGGDRGIRVAPALLVDPDGHGLDQLAKLMGERKLVVQVAESFPLAQAAAAHAIGESNATAGKLVLTVRSETGGTP